ncbi:MAG: acyl-CoA carboxylase subunit beta [bacterium]|nr:acyl-CoA carboxylase subunit beta [bacterium]
MPNEEKYRKLAELRSRVLTGDEARIQKQHDKGKLTARERIEILFDDGTFQELDQMVVHRCHDFGMEENKPLGDGVITGYGMIEGRLTYAFAQDFTAFGGTLSRAHGEKICKVMDLSLKTGAPIVGINDSGGARIQEGVDSLAAYADVFLRNTMASGVVPQISAIMGPCAGGAVYSPAVTDFAFMVDGTSHMFLTGPDVIKTVMNEEVTFEELGGAKVHASKSGVCHVVAPDEFSCLREIRRMLQFFPQDNMADPPPGETNDEPGRMEEKLDEIVPDSPNKPYDMKEIIKLVVDDGDFFQTHADFAPNHTTGFARFGGRPVGIVAHQPAVLAGCLDIDSSAKSARMIRFCDCFNLPVITFSDVPGFLPGTDQEYRGVIKHGAMLLYAYAEATVPKIHVITRKSYGGAYAVTSNRHMRGDIVYAWPTAEIAVMGAEGAVQILYRKELKDSKDPKTLADKLAAEFRDKFADPYTAAGLGFVDEVIMPAETRPKIIAALQMLNHKRDHNPPKKHGNIPL